MILFSPGNFFSGDYVSYPGYSSLEATDESDISADAVPLGYEDGQIVPRGEGGFGILVQVYEEQHDALLWRRKTVEEDYSACRAYNAVQACFLVEK